MRVEKTNESCFYNITECGYFKVKMKLYHVTTQKKARRYQETGYIKSPVRGLTTLKAAMFWAMKTNRKIIYEVESVSPHKLPDHHNEFGEAWWNDENISIENIKCVVSAT